MPKSHTRRRVLAALGAAAVGGLAGCSEEGATTPTATGTPTETMTPAPTASIPSYADFLPAGDGPVVFTAFDLQIEGGHQIATVPEEPTDPLRYGSVAGAYADFLVGLLMQNPSYPFEEQRLDTENREHNLNVNGVVVQELPVALDEAVADAEADAEANVAFEADDRAVVENATGGTFGLTTDALVFPVLSSQSGTDQLVRDIVDTRAGAATPRHEDDEAFADLLRNGATTGSVACGYAPGSDLATAISESGSSVTLPTTGFGSASGALFGIDLDNGDPPQPADGTIRYPEEAAVDTDALSPVGSAATNRELTQDGRTVRVTGEYSWAALSEFDAASNGS